MCNTHITNTYQQIFATFDQRDDDSRERGEIYNVNEKRGDYDTQPPTFRAVHQSRQNNPLSTANLEIEAYTFQRGIKPESNESLLSNRFCINMKSKREAAFELFPPFHHSILRIILSPIMIQNVQKNYHFFPPSSFTISENCKFWNKYYLEAYVRKFRNSSISSLFVFTFHPNAILPQENFLLSSRIYIFFQRDWRDESQFRAQTLLISLCIIAFYHVQHVVSNKYLLHVPRCVCKMSEISGGPAAKTNTWICQADSAVNHLQPAPPLARNSRREANYSRIAINKARNSGTLPPRPVNHLNECFC